MSNIESKVMVNTAITQNAKLANTYPSQPLRKPVHEFIRKYLLQLENTPTNLYAQVMAAIEPALLESVLQYASQNQTTAARLLKISRGTLRKKMAAYGLLLNKKILTQPQHD